MNKQEIMELGGAMRQAIMQFMIDNEITDMNIISKAIYHEKLVDSFLDMYSDFKETVPLDEDESIVVDMLTYLEMTNEQDEYSIIEAIGQALNEETSE
jgi:hypothetical protein